jgi:hypothetical protein
VTRLVTGHSLRIFFAHQSTQGVQQQQLTWDEVMPAGCKQHDPSGAASELRKKRKHNLLGLLIAGLQQFDSATQDLIITDNILVNQDDCDTSRYFVALAEKQKTQRTSSAEVRAESSVDDLRPSQVCWVPQIYLRALTLMRLGIRWISFATLH